MIHSHLRISLAFFILITFVISSCSPGVSTAVSSPTVPTTHVLGSAAAGAMPDVQTPQPTPYLEVINPLTGLAVEDPSLLQLPATLLSISHFPVTARPQAGLSFAAYVFEIYITEGATRFLTTFYGQIPTPEVPIVGNCEVRREIFTQTNLILGNQVW